MSIKVGINGFGRIGRNVLRSAVQNFPDIEIVGINDLLEPDYLAYMLQYDSVHGRFKGDVSVKDGHLVVNGKTIRLTAERDPANLKWDEIGADIVIESTGPSSIPASSNAGAVIPGDPVTGRNNYYRTGTSNLDTNNTDVRIDRNFGAAGRGFARYSHRYTETVPAQYFPDDLTIAEGRIVEENRKRPRGSRRQAGSRCRPG